MAADQFPHMLSFKHLLPELAANTKDVDAAGSVGQTDGRKGSRAGRVALS